MTEEEWESPDKAILKKIIKYGSGISSPNTRSHCKIIIQDISNLLDPTQDQELKVVEGDVLDYIIGEYDSVFTDFIDKSLESMKEGEKAEIEQTNLPENGFADELFPRPTLFNLELVTFERSKEYYELAQTEKLNIVKHSKERGSSLYKLNKIDRAFKRFSYAYKCLIAMGKESDIEPDLISEERDMKCVCCMNMAACFVKNKRWNNVVTHCTNGLKISPNNVKGLFRRAQAYYSLGEIRNAKEDLNKARELEPDNTAVKQLLKQVIDQEKKEDETLAKAMKKAFT